MLETIIIFAVVIIACVLVIVLAFLRAGSQQDTNSDVVPSSEDIHLWVKRGNVDRVKILLEFNPDAVNFKDSEEKTPLHWAVYNNQRDIINVLLEAGANVNVTEVIGITPLHYAAERGYVEVVELLLDAGADVNAQDYGYFNFTPLHGAAGFGRFEIVKLLLRTGAKVNLRDNEGRTALDLAAKNGHKDVVELIKKHWW